MMISTAMPSMVFLCSRFQKIADSSAILDDVSHQVEFSSKQASKQVACQRVASHSDFLIPFSAIWSGALSCPDFRKTYKISQRIADKGTCVSSSAFCLGNNNNSREFQR